MDLYDCWDLTFEDCDFFDNKENPLISNSNSLNTTFRGCRIYNNWAEGVLFSTNEPSDEHMNSVRDAWERHCKGQKQREGVTFTLDVNNGFAAYEYREVEEGVEFVSRTEMCYWNEADQKHKLFAYNTWSFENGKPILGQYDGLTFCRYDNAKKIMVYTADAGVDSALDATGPDVTVTFSLPRSGKDLTITRWLPGGLKQSQTLKWNGYGFNGK